MADNVVLPANIQLKYLNEGAANIVYNICFTPKLNELLNLIRISDKTYSAGRKDEYSIYANKLLRLRKNVPFTSQVLISQSNWINHIAPLFHESEIVQQSLVAIRSSGIVSRLNDELRKWEQCAPFPGLKQRLEFRRGTYLADEEFGLLVTDMTPRDRSNILVEFKPKWLIQSPSAPPNSKRCRQCAMKARANVKSKNSGVDNSTAKKFCPLSLLSDDEKVITSLADILLPPQSDQVYVQHFVSWVKNSSLLRRLRELQIQFDRTGVLNVDSSDQNFLIAMTIRDCTIFLQFSKSGEVSEARIGDLDLKCATKIPGWKRKERELIHGGWYEENEDIAHRQPNYCVLSRR